MRAEIAFVGDVAFIATDSGVRAGALAITGVIAQIRVDANDAVSQATDGFGGTDIEAGGVFALHAQCGQKIAGDAGVFAMLPLINLGAIATERDVIFDFAGYRAGVAADAALNVKR